MKSIDSVGIQCYRKYCKCIHTVLQKVLTMYIYSAIESIESIAIWVNLIGRYNLDTQVYGSGSCKMVKNLKKIFYDYENFSKRQELPCYFKNVKKCKKINRNIFKIFCDNQRYILKMFPLFFCIFELTRQLTVQLYSAIVSIDSVGIQ